MSGLISPVPAPPALPPSAGLVPVLTRLGNLYEADGHERWEDGYAYAPEGVGAGQHAQDDCDNTKVGTDPAAGAVADTVVEVKPFLVVTTETCSAFGWTQRDFEGRAYRRMQAMQSKIIERELWMGEVAVAAALPNKFLSQAALATDVNPAGAVSVRAGLGLLEERVGDLTSGVSVLHVSRRIAPLMPDSWAEAMLYDQLDTTVVLGAGYTGVGPGGVAAAAGEEWIYMTDAVAVRLGPIEIFPERVDQALDRSVNTISYTAQRYAGVSWAGGATLAVRVTTNPA